ncbi:MAG: phosphatase PAP2 family protein [Nevskia sp.]|nr:phosphatase PAP2 family protein [Nevskia sp.]
MLQTAFPNAARRLSLLCAATAALTAGPASADGNFIDHRLSRNTGGIYAAQDAVPVALALASAGCALWEGTQDPLGRTCWESGESIAIGGVSAEALQYITGRRSPSDTTDPGHWFSGAKGSFPSLHVTATTAAVTPFILQYVKDDPWVASLALLPAYEMVARVKAQEHWQTDVLAGALLGFGVGAYEYQRNSPFVFYLLPGGAFAGFSRKF